MNAFDKLLFWLDGKKTIVAGLALVILPYLATQGIINEQLSALIQSIIGILMGGGKILTDLSIKNNTDLGLAIKQKRIK